MVFSYRQMQMNTRGGSLIVKQRTFQFADGGATPTSPLHFTITQINHGCAKAFVEEWHYSKRIPTGKNISFGLWTEDLLYSVIVYGIGVNPFQAKFLGVGSIIEIKRLCRSEPKKPYELSRFIRLTLKMVKKLMLFDAVVAFADPEHGHEGTVYKASGFKHEGDTNQEWHLVGANGEIRHRRFAFRMARRNNITIDEARDELGMERIKTLPKRRWVLRFKKERS